MRRDLREMVVVITGASSGIGRALAERLAARGARLVLAARRRERLDELNRQLGGAHEAVECDVARREDCEALVRRAAQRFGRIDTLVCNAGYGMIRRVAEMPADEVEQIYRTNVFGTLDCIRAATPLMRGQWPRDGRRGQIVVVSSAAARRGLPDFGVYASTKAAQLSLAEALRVELQPAGIAVTSVHPVGTGSDFFNVAERLSGQRMLAPGVVEVRQTPETVARKITAAIERPRPEVWPLRASRWGLSVATLFPGLTDRLLARYRRIEGTNQAQP